MGIVFHTSYSGKNMKSLKDNEKIKSNIKGCFDFRKL